MKLKTTAKHLVVIAILLLTSCEGELEDCYNTVCTGPDNTNCREEPNFNSGCFPMNSGSSSHSTALRTGSVVSLETPVSKNKTSNTTIE